MPQNDVNEKDRPFKIMLPTLATATLVGLAAAAPAADKVDVLPGFEPTNFSVYSGMYCTPGPCRCRVHVQHEDLVDPTLRNRMPLTDHEALDHCKPCVLNARHQGTNAALCGGCASGVLAIVGCFWWQ
jgi:hypothetical protein